MINFKWVISSIVVTSAIFSCDAQIKKQENGKKTVSIEKTEGTNPKIKTKVNKQYDSKGNIVKFDSTYSYYYTSRGIDSARIISDIVFKEFKSFYSDELMSKFNMRFNDIFLVDSLFKYDFINEDYFRKRFELNESKMNELFREMDSLKVIYYKKYHSDKAVKKNKK